MPPEEVKVTVAALAGLASFASPCILPLVPAYLGMITGLNLESLSGNRKQVLFHSLLFVLGFSLLFVVSGAAATALGRALNRYMDWIQRLGGLALIVLGLHMVGFIRLPFLYRERSLRAAARQPRAGYLASFLTGMFFFSGWVPCVGPVLMAIYMLAGGSQTVGQGTLLLLAYSLGLGVPFVLIALFAGYLIPLLRRAGKVVRWVEVASGVLVIIMGVAVFSDSLTVFMRYQSLFGL